MPKHYYLFFAIFLFFSPSLTAQYQSVIGNNNTSWVMKQWLITVNSVQCITDSTWIDHSTDTTFQNNTFKPILGISSLDRNTRVRGFVAEDTVSGEVLFKNMSSDTTIYKIMDMSLSLNDTFMLDFGILGSTPSVVDSVYSLGGKKVIRLDYQESIYNSNGIKFYNYTMIEGVGVNFKGVNNNTPSDAILDTNWRNNSLNYVAPSDTFLVCNLSTGIQEYRSSRQIKLYPNPASNQLSIDGISQGNFQIFNIEGKLLKSGDISPQIDVSDLADGLYFISMDQKCRMKFIIDQER